MRINRKVICNIGVLGDGKIDLRDEHCINKCYHGAEHLNDECLSLFFCEITKQKVKCIEIDKYLKKRKKKQV